MNGAVLMVRELEELGVRHIFGYPGGAIMPFYDALLESSLEHVLCRHEQGAAFAAGGYARATRRVGVCVATSGPGATNLVTGIADAFMDSVPLVAITGQVPTALLGTDAFQEVDIVGMTLPVVKHSFLIRRAEDIAPTVREAFRIATEGRPGPVLIDLPKDLATQVVEPSPQRPPAEVEASTPSNCEEALRLFSSAERPIVLAGGGLAASGALPEFRAFVERTGIPVVTTLHGVGVLPTGHERLLGMLGMHGNQAANRCVQAADLLICMGARFDDRATGKLDAFAPEARVIHMDVDPAEIGKLKRAHVSIVGDLMETLPHFAPPRPSIDAWRTHCDALRDHHRWRYDAPGEGVHGPGLIRELTQRAGDFVLASDVGQHQMWIAQHGVFETPEQHLSSGGLGAMGFGLPAAIGAQFARPEATVVALSGDGSFMMNVQELATLKRYGLPVKLIVLDNSALGLVRQWQECFFENRFSEVDLSDNPDFTEVARAFGIPALSVDRRDQVGHAISALLSSTGPMLLHARIDARENVWPLVPPNKANDQMIEEVPRCTSSRSA